MNITRDTADRAVSPVVGVILMVALVVILAAVVGAVAFGLTPSLSESVNAAVAVDGNPNTIDVTVNDMGNADRVLVESPQRTVELTSVGETATIDRSGCRVTVYGEQDGDREVLTSFHASIEGGTASLVSMWSFEDCQRNGDQLVDSTGQKTGTVEGDPQLVEGVAGDAYRFDGQDDRILIGSRGEFEDITVSVWVQPTEDNGWIGGNGAKWRIRDIPSDDRFQFWMREDGFGTSTTVNAYPGEDISDKWWHVVGVYNTTAGTDDTMAIYINGQLMDSQTTGLNLDSDGHENMVIADDYESGNDPDPNRYDEAVIDEFRIYSTDLSGTEVQALCERDAPAGHPCAP